MNIKRSVSGIIRALLLFPSLAFAQGYSVVPVEVPIGAYLDSSSQRGGLPFFTDAGFSRQNTGFIGEDGRVELISPQLFNKELSSKRKQSPYLNAVVDRSTFIINSDKRNGLVKATVKGKKVSIKAIAHSRGVEPLAVNSQGQVLLSEVINPKSSSDKEPNQFRLRFFDGAKVTTVYQTKLPRDSAPIEDGKMLVSFGFVDDSSRWFISGIFQSGSSEVFFSGFGDGRVAEISEKPAKAGGTPKDTAWIVGAGKGQLLSSTETGKVTLSSSDGRLLASADGHMDAFLSPDGDAFLSRPDSSGFSLTRLTPSGLATIRCPSLGDGVTLLHGYTNGNLLVNTPENKVYLLKKGGVDCTR